MNKIVRISAALALAFGFASALIGCNDSNQLDICVQGRANDEKRYTEQRNKDKADQEKALDDIETALWMEYDHELLAISKAARLRSENPSLPRPSEQERYVVDLDNGSGQKVSRDLFPAEAKQLKSAQAKLENGYIILAKLGRGYCENNQSFKGLAKGCYAGKKGATAHALAPLSIREPAPRDPCAKSNPTVHRVADAAVPSEEEGTTPF